MASGAISKALRKISELRVVDLKSELKRRSLDTSGIKSVLVARLKQAIEKEDGDTGSVEIQLPVSTPTRKSGKGKGRRMDSDLDTTTEEDMPSKEMECESEKDIADTDDGTQGKCKPALCEDITQTEAEMTAEVEPDTEAEVGPEPEMDAEIDAKPEGVADAEQEANADGEPQVDVKVEAEGEAEPDLDAEPDGEAEPDLDAEPDQEAKPDLDAEPDQEAEPDLDTEPDQEAEPDLDGEPDLDADPGREAEPDLDAKANFIFNDLEAELDGEAYFDLEPEIESEDEMAIDALDSPKEAEEDHLSVSIQNEDAIITLEIDGDDLLEPGKHVKLPDSETDKGIDGPEASAEMSPDDMKIEEKDDKDHDGSWDEHSKDDRGATKKAETGEKDKDSGKKGPSTGVSGQAKSSSRERDGKDAKGEHVVGGSSGINSSSYNLWVSGLSFNTKAADLKNLFGKYGKVLSAKVLTNARSPGSKCYGLVTMSSSAEVTRCISQLDCTELDGQQIYVEGVKNYPFKKESSKTDMDDKASSSKSSEKRSLTGSKPSIKSQPPHKNDKSVEKDKDSSKAAKGGKNDCGSTSSGQGPSKRDDRGRGRAKSSGDMVEEDPNKGKSNIVKTRPFKKTRYFEKPFNMNDHRRSKWFIPPEELEMVKGKQRQFANKMEDFLPFEKIMEQKMRNRRITEIRRHREIAEQMRRQRECEERENIIRERQRLEMERQKLERERFEREKLERERIRIEHERRKEAEQMAREQELRRQEHIRFELEKRNLKRGRDIEHGRRDNAFWNGNKKIQSNATVGRPNQGPNINRQQNRFSNFNPREKSRFPQAAVEQPNTYDRRNRFEGEPEAKKSRHSPQTTGAAFERYPKNFEVVRRANPPHSRTELRDTDRRDRDERRPVQMQDRQMVARMSSNMSHPRSPRDAGHSWKNESSMNANKGDLRGPMRMRPQRSGRDGPGPALRGGSSASRGRGSFNERDVGRPMGMNESFNSGRQVVVVERHSREQAMRKDWNAGSASQRGGFSNSRRMANSRGSMMSPPSGHSGINRIVQITSNSIPSGGNSGVYKSFKGSRPF
ncbi:SAFB-like transcription modulator [Nerophis ophidion]|uniref:SAFB-like transcription modulator n=1 Tax=Nerophis ophidion TaxID=159077 RepID=UPI002AE06FF8|nr:SAFB-like transcription modulator [Nerophis ophidion]